MQSPAVHRLPPLKMPGYDGQSSPPGHLSSFTRAPTLLSPTYERPQERSYGQYSSPLPGPSEVARNGKRGFENAFRSVAARQDERLLDGMRPSHPSMGDVDDDDFMEQQVKMSYKRADGAQYTRELPTAQ